VTTAASRHLLDRLASLGAEAAQLELVPLGTDLSAFGSENSAAPALRERLGVGESDVVVLGIGRLVRLKGFEYLIRALALVRERAQNVRLVIAGDGEMRAELSGLSRRLGLDERVAFVGAVERRDVPAYFAAADIVAVPTLHENGFAEGLGYVVLEAQATGRAVIATRVGGLPEVVRDGENGILVSERDPRALADAIVALAQQPELRRRLGHSGRAQAAAAPSWDDVARMWVDLYERLVDARSRPSATAAANHARPPAEAAFDGSAYWEQRLQGNFDLEGVGFSRLGHRYNRWMYRVRGEVFDREVDRHLGPRFGREEPLRVLDVGSGTGFYVDRWLRRGANVTGVDLTEIAVGRLATAYPDARFIRADIGRPLDGELQTLEGTMDAVSAFDVLFHITDDDAYAQALANVRALLRPGGLFMWSDNFLHGPTVRLRHQVSRSLIEITQAVSEAGLTVVDRVPMFMLMNQPTDVRSRWPRVAWSAMLSPAVISDRLGGGLGALLYPLERRLVSRLHESPTTELMVCERPSPA
jgi:2-polyprenyl-3-methyl-5-hydroxy-6-metoxy-1,4-benzoquinol methylase